MLFALRLFAVMGGNLRTPAIIIRSVKVAHGLASCLEGGPNCRRSIIPSSCAHCIASSTLQAFCLSAMPIVSNVFEISLARAVAALSTCIRYSLSPLVSPSFGLPWLWGFGTEVTSRVPSVIEAAAVQGCRFFLPFQIYEIEISAEAESVRRALKVLIAPQWGFKRRTFG